MPTFGQRSNPAAAPNCPRHPHERSVDYCKRCNRPMCVACAIPTEVRAICVDCTTSTAKRMRARSFGMPVTTALIGLCAVLYVADWLLPVYQWFAFYPPSAYYEPWRFLTTAFLHSGLMHLAFNMLALYWMGQYLEPLMGTMRYIGLYALSALGGTTFVLAWVLVSPASFTTVTVGASGAVFGLFGAIFVLQKAVGADTRSIFVLLAINLAYGFIVPGISWQGHVGGLLVGVAVAWLLLKTDRPRPGVTERTQNLQAAGVLGVTAVILLAAQSGIYSLLINWYG
ncbi:rhomboid family intramembrane serine protease [Schaalia canis]|uniref:Rhomboid family intramembrane serine protease n=2 Tax=Schaalia canis TaxID=100469 RepID=A0A3P1SDR1_9ACTO|nr:rhomboid family intramembrane serine protease [Schaalia canis]